MKEIQCRHCGYRQRESELLEQIMEPTVFPAFTNNYIPFMNMQMFTEERVVCPYCGRADGWTPL